VTAGQLGERGHAARQQLQLLFPPPLRVERSPDHHLPEVASWVGVPSARNPRLLVGVTTAKGSSRIIRRQMSGRRPRTTTARLAFGTLARAGLLKTWPAMRWTVSGPPESDHLARRLSEILSEEDLRLTLAVGPARANRKPVIQVTDRAANQLAFVKVGHNPLTRALVDREAEVLPRLQTALPDVHTPSVLAAFEWQDCRVLVQSPLDIPTRRLPEPQHTVRFESVVNDIAAVGGLTSVPWERHPHRDRLLDALASFPRTDADVSGRVRRILDQVPSGLVILTGSWHGDLNGGNFALTHDRTLVWDWERFESGAPFGFDLLHHALHRDITVRHVAPADAVAHLLRRAPDMMQRLGGSASTAPWVTRLYLMTLALRYAGDAQTTPGADLAQVQDWLLPVVESCSGEASTTCR
jgi:hypothetical protein